jgi:hypothetical protein
VPIRSGQMGRLQSVSFSQDGSRLAGAGWARQRGCGTSHCHVIFPGGPLRIARRSVTAQELPDQRKRSGGQSCCMGLLEVCRGFSTNRGPLQCRFISDTPLARHIDDHVFLSATPSRVA